MNFTLETNIKTNMYLSLTRTKRKFKLSTCNNVFPKSIFLPLLSNKALLVVCGAVMICKYSNMQEDGEEGAGEGGGEGEGGGG